jgi:hypothetical protein
MFSVITARDHTQIPFVPEFPEFFRQYFFISYMIMLIHHLGWNEAVLESGKEHIIN